MNHVKFHRDSLLCPSFKRRAQAGQSIRNMGVVLDVPISKVAWKFFRPPVYQDILDKTSHQSLVSLGLLQINCLGRSVNHRMTARVRRRRSLLEVVPVLDDLAVFKSENIKTNFRTKEIIVGVSKNPISILENAGSTNSRRIRRELLHYRPKSRQSVSDAKIMLDVFLRIYVTDGLVIPSFDTFQKLKDLLLLNGIVHIPGILKKPFKSCNFRVETYAHNRRGTRGNSSHAKI